MTNCPVTRFACPIHKITLGSGLICSECGKGYPSVDGVPILLNESNSVFGANDYVSDKAYGGASSYAGSLDKRTGLRQLYRRAVFRLSEQVVKKEFDVNDAVQHILAVLPRAEILVIGSGDTTVRGNVTYTDVAFGANVDCIADAHDLPFIDQSFDACIAVAVLEHVVDPYRCVQEVCRVLRPDGFVYAETPFMQPVHMGAHDFTRFSYLGHRRLFRNFNEVRSGIAGGAGTSAAQLLRYALSATSSRPTLIKWLNLFGLLCTYPLRWLDYLSHANISAYNSASAFYFFGSLRVEPITDRELLTFFRGT